MFHCNILYMLIYIITNTEASFMSRRKNQYKYVPSEEIFSATNDNDVLDYDINKWPGYYIQQKKLSIPDDVIPASTTTDMKRKTLRTLFPPTKPTTLPYLTPKITGERNTVFHERNLTKNLPWLFEITVRKITKSTTTNELMISLNLDVESRGDSKYPVTIIRSTRSDIKNYLRQHKVIQCYYCGMQDEGYPEESSCYRVFDWADKRFHINRSYSIESCKELNADEDFERGCFKRYLDIGNQYIERGCRFDPPAIGRSVVSENFAILE
ncbi:unnamed protein product, partial [Leptidea sinapis]